MLGCFHILAIVNTIYNTIVIVQYYVLYCCYEHCSACIFFKLLFFRSEIAASYGSFKFFEEPPYFFPVVAVPICIPINSMKEFPFLQIFTNICYL